MHPINPYALSDVDLMNASVRQHSRWRIRILPDRAERLRFLYLTPVLPAAFKLSQLAQERSPFALQSVRR